ncbi:hypothetical protein SR1949_38110 [Sphaerospermopsis reniformis]|uniref:Uncharacterized protein n=1 Tax=Sphaerospermopsis reniformis TaxID=531300 RepID=A0A480A4W6_9CYAN|nr:hypothetical protein SR1949_38110 [Sphaerospermopsis reniformis]
MTFPALVKVNVPPIVLLPNTVPLALLLVTFTLPVFAKVVVKLALLATVILVPAFWVIVPADVTVKLPLS